jgi:hypothetical protein
MMFTGGEEGIEQDLSDMLNFRNEHQEFWATRGEFDLDADPTGHLIIVKRHVGDKHAVVVVNTSTDKSVAIPVGYRGWNLGAQSGAGSDELQPLGYFFASKG